MKLSLISDAIVKVQEKYHVENPEAVVVLFPGKEFVIVGDKDRDRSDVAKRLIDIAAHELSGHFNTEWRGEP